MRIAMIALVLAVTGGTAAECQSTTPPPAPTGVLRCWTEPSGERVCGDRDKAPRGSYHFGPYQGTTKV